MTNHGNSSHRQHTIKDGRLSAQTIRGSSNRGKARSRGAVRRAMSMMEGDAAPNSSITYYKVTLPPMAQALRHAQVSYGVH